MGSGWTVTVLELRAILRGGFIPLVALSSACGGDSSDKFRFEGSSSRDSAGIRIVESVTPSWGDEVPWTIDPTPVVVIGAVENDPAQEFTHISSSIRLPNGGFAAVDLGAGGPYLRIFDEQGSQVNTAGGRGPGPGQFLSEPGLRAGPGDTIVAADRRGYRYTWFTLDGRVVRTVPISQAASHHFQGVSSMLDLALFPDGDLLFAGEVPPAAQYRRDSPVGAILLEDAWADFEVRLNLILRGGTEGVLIGQFPRVERAYLRGQTDAGPTTLFLVNPFHAPAPHAAGVRQRQVHVVTPSLREIRSFGVDGRLHRIVRLARPLIPVRGAEIDHFRNMVRDSARARGVSIAAALSLAGRIELPDSLPPYIGLHADLEGNLWAEENRYPPSETHRHFHVIDSEGAWLGTIDLPVHVGEIQEIGSDYLLTAWTDSLDVPYLRMYRLDR